MSDNILRIYLTTSIGGVRYLGYLILNYTTQRYQLYYSEGHLIKEFTAKNISFAICKAREYLHRHVKAGLAPNSI